MKIAIIGASYLQKPLVLKAKDMGVETHVFAWREGNVVEDLCDYYYEISILDKEEILSVCRKVKIDGITSIASDLAMLTVNYVAKQLGLNGNSLLATKISTDKFLMKNTLVEAGLLTHNYYVIHSLLELVGKENRFPCIVKPVDRSGSRGVSMVVSQNELAVALSKALSVSLNSTAIVEDFVSGKEFSVEFISFKGVHYPLVITEKVTSGFPHFVESEHHQPAQLLEDVRQKIFDKVQDCLTALGLENGASHTEVFLLDNSEIHVIEVAGRMGGDFIGSHLVQLSTGFDFVRACIDVAFNKFTFENYASTPTKPYSGVYYVLPKIGKIKSIHNNANKYDDIVSEEVFLKAGDVVEDIDGSDKRAGCFIYNSLVPKPIAKPEEVLKFTTE